MASPAGPPEWRKYFYPGTEVLRNKLDIRDPDELQRLEYDVTEQQAAALRNGDLPIEGDTAGERLSSGTARETPGFSRGEERASTRPAGWQHTA